MSRFTDNDQTKHLNDTICALAHERQDLKDEIAGLRDAGDELARASEQTHDGCSHEAWERQDRALNEWDLANKGERT